MKKGEKSGGMTQEDIALWHLVLKSVKGYGRKRRVTETPSPVISAPKSTSKTITRPAQKSLPPAKTAREMDRATKTKLEKGKLDIEGQIDLHGMTQEKAFTALQNFILSAAKREKRTLLVITGKGSLSGKTGVLRQMLPLWLEDNPLVLAITQARPKDGGTGAFYVRLRKNK